MRAKAPLDSGEVTSQTVIILPVIIVVLFLAIQSALYFHISHVAGAAAAQGAAAASAKSLTSSQAIQRGRESADVLVRDSGTDFASPTVVLVTSEEVRVTVTTRVPRVVPFFPLSASRTVVEPRERFIMEFQR